MNGISHACKQRLPGMQADVLLPLDSNSGSEGRILGAAAACVGGGGQNVSLRVASSFRSPNVLSTRATLTQNLFSRTEGMG